VEGSTEETPEEKRQELLEEIDRFVQNQPEEIAQIVQAWFDGRNPLEHGAENIDPSIDGTPTGMQDGSPLRPDYRAPESNPDLPTPGAQTLAARDDTDVADALGREIIAIHLIELLRQLADLGKARDGAGGSVVVHIDGRWGSGKTTLVRLLQRKLALAGSGVAGGCRPHSKGMELDDPIVVTYDAWRESAIAPEWWSLSSKINHAVRRQRMYGTRLLMTIVGLVERTARSSSLVTSIIVWCAIVGAYAAGWWRNGEGLLKWLTVVTTVSTLGLAAGRVLFWASPTFGNLYVRNDENPLGEISEIVSRLRRWAPRARRHHAAADALLTVWLCGISIQMVCVLMDASMRHRALPTIVLLGNVKLRSIVAVVAAVAAAAVAWDYWRIEVKSGSLWIWNRLFGTPLSPRALRVLLAMAAAVATLVVFSIPVPVFARQQIWSHPGVWFSILSASGIAGYALWTVRALSSNRRPLMLIIDDLDRCSASRTVKLLEAVHTLLRHRENISWMIRWRSSASFIVLVLADGRWIRSAFESEYANFQQVGSMGHKLGAEFIQKLFDHTVIVPSLTAGQVSAMLHLVTDAPRTSGESWHQMAEAAPDVGELIDSEFGEEVTENRAEHLLAQYFELMPSNPRLIKRVANTWGMLRAVQLHLNLNEKQDTVVRAAIMFVRFPSLVDELLSSAESPLTQVLAKSSSGSAASSVDAASAWLRPEVQRLLTDEHGDAVDIAAIARCYGHVLLGHAPPPDRDSVAESLKVDPLELVLSRDLVDLVDPNRGGDLLDRVRALRRKLALDLGVVLPPVRIRDGSTLALGTYQIRIGEVTAATGEALPGHLLAIGDVPDTLPGRRTSEPAFGLPAVWVPIEHRKAAEVAGVTLVERAAVVTTHLAETVRQHASRLLSLDDVRELVDVLRTERPTTVEELIPGLLPLSSVQRVLQGLLDEQVSIRDLGRVLEGVAQRARATTDADALLEAARASLGPALTAPFARDGVLHVITLDPDVEQEAAEAKRASEQGVVLAMHPAAASRMVKDLSALVARAENNGMTPVLLVAGPLRLPLRRLLRGSLPHLPVIGFAETAGVTSIETVGQVSRDDSGDPEGRASDGESGRLPSTGWPS
jgi:hypothetical protein